MKGFLKKHPEGFSGIIARTLDRYKGLILETESLNSWYQELNSQVALFLLKSVEKQLKNKEKQEIYSIRARDPSLNLYNL